MCGDGRTNVGKSVFIDRNLIENYTVFSVFINLLYA